MTAADSVIHVDFTLATPRFGDAAQTLAKNGYSPLPLVWGAKYPDLSGWPKYQYANADARKYENCGTGILCGDIVAVDIDVPDEALAMQLQALVQRMLGPAPVRIGASPKRLLPYRVEGAQFKKLATPGYRLPGDTPEAKPHRVEILARGQQFVAHNIHPETGLPYRWLDSRGPMNICRSKLTAVTYSQVEAFIEAATALLAQHGKPVGKRAEAETADREHKPSAELRAAEPAVLRDALASIPNDDDCYDDWIGMCYAIKAALGEDGFPDWLAWSAKSAKDVPATTERVWRSAKPNQKGAGSIYFHAQLNGWKRSSSVSAAQVVLQRASEIPMEPIEWLWPGWLAVGKLHMLGGVPGTGKTTIALSLAAIVSRGGKWA
jgi:putative DNA primase/helicase